MKKIFLCGKPCTFFLLLFTLLWAGCGDDVTQTVDLTRRQHTVTFNANGGIPTVIQQEIPHGNIIEDPPDVAKTGFALDGWYKDADLKYKWNLSSDTVSGPLTLYAKWIRQSYIVTFAGNGGSPAPAEQAVNIGGKVQEPLPISLLDIPFGGWYTESGFVNKWNFSTGEVTADITLYAKWNFELPLANVNYAAPYLSYVEGGASVTGPVKLPMNIALGTMTAGNSGWRNLLAALETAGKYINLDLSVCSMDGTEFNPNCLIPDGKSFIVSVVLPDAAESIIAGTSSDSAAFRHFSALKNVTGNYVTEIGNYAFYELASLARADFPEAVTIGTAWPAAYVFYRCTSLESADYPKAITAGGSSFYGCSSLKNVNMPAVETFGQGAFDSCASLKNLSFPAASSIGGLVFNSCTALESIEFPDNLPYIDYNPFMQCPLLTISLIPSGGNLTVIESGRALVRNAGELLSYPSASGNISLNGITSVAAYAFNANTAMERITLQSAVTVSWAFAACTALLEATFPAATSVREFNNCTELRLLYLPKVTELVEDFLRSTGSKPISIYLGDSAPALGTNIFRDVNGINGPKNVTVYIPAGATGYTSDWIEGFKGRGWDGSVFGSGTANENVNVAIQNY